MKKGRNIEIEIKSARVKRKKERWSKEEKKKKALKIYYVLRERVLMVQLKQS